MRRTTSAVLTIGLAIAGVARGAAPVKVVVDAGPHDRIDTPVHLDLGGKAREVRLREVLASGVTSDVPSQPENGRVHWILKGRTKAGSKRTFVIETDAGGPAATGPFSATDEAGRLVIRSDGKRVLQYNHGDVTPPSPRIPKIQTRSAYIHPLWDPSGRVITDDWPSDHYHHRGIWAPWTKTEFQGRHPDFWNLGTGTGTIAFDDFEQRFLGPVFAGFRVRHKWVDLKGGVVALREVWDLKVFAQGEAGKGYWLFDLVSTQWCATDDPLKLPKYYYGGLGYRGAREWSGKNAPVRFLTSEGKDRSNGNETRGRWCDLTGKIGGDWTGVTILCHPSNYRHPQPMRIHPSIPFFCFCASQLGDWEISPGKPYVSRYRFYVHEGELNRDELERLWRDFAEPPAVTRAD